MERYLIIPRPTTAAGLWYTLELDYDRIARIMRQVGYRGFVLLKFEGKDVPKTTLPQSLSVEAFARRAQGVGQRVEKGVAFGRLPPKFE